MFNTELQCFQAICAWTKHRLAEPDNMYNVAMLYMLKRRLKFIQQQNGTLPG